MAGPGERDLNLGISDSEYKLSYICALATGSTGFRSSGYASSKQKWLKILTQRLLNLHDERWEAVFGDGSAH